MPRSTTLIKPKPKIKIVQSPPPFEQVPTEILADAIVSMSEGIAKLRSGKLTDRALFLLIQNAAPTKLSLENIKSVLNAIEDLRTCFIRKGS